jgi:hypothetical protein
MSATGHNRKSSAVAGISASRGKAEIIRAKAGFEYLGFAKMGGKRQGVANDESAESKVSFGFTWASVIRADCRIV